MTAVLAHSGPPALPGTWAGLWRLDPLPLLALASAAGLYMVGFLALRASAGTRGPVSTRQASSFGAGLAVIAIALVSPLEALSESLFSAHMVQHLLLTLVAPPLLVLGAPLQVGVWALPGHRRRAAGRLLGAAERALPHRAAVGLASFAAFFWLWHLPTLYEAAVAHTPIHVLEHTTLLLGALLFWDSVVRARADRRWMGLPLLLTGAVQGGLLAVLLTFTGRAWYPVHRPTVLQWGLTPLQDQQLAGVIMWVPGGVVYLLAAALLFVRWLRDDERREDRALARLATR